MRLSFTLDAEDELLLLFMDGGGEQTGLQMAV